MRRFFAMPLEPYSGVSTYAQKFFHYVAKDFGFTPIDLTFRVQNLRAGDHIHFESSMFFEQGWHPLIDHLSRYAADCRVSMMLHDPPFTGLEPRVIARLTRQLPNSLARPILRNLNGKYFSSFSLMTMSRLAKSQLESFFNVGHVCFVPMLVPEVEINDVQGARGASSFVFFGNIGKTKGLEYALLLFAAIRRECASATLEVVGLGSPSFMKTIHNLVEAHQITGVTFHGFQSEAKAQAIFDRTRFALLPYKDYQNWLPVSGSLLNVMQRGVVPLVTPVNGIPELIRPEVNGYFLTKNLATDLVKVLNLIRSPAVGSATPAIITDYVREQHNTTLVKRHFEEFLLQMKSQRT